ncbi:teyrha-meyrha isoform X2 [Haematobia irritans]|uniref:teyrha-meyrha isoform X2 n=1 Tax=Haematobia irritans TaxID=7368 RepID=UPI003F4F5967
MESNAFGSSHIPSQALVVLSEAASGLHEALRGQRPFPSRLPDAKDLHNMSLVGSYGSHLLHSFHPHLLQTLNHGMLAANGTAAAASYFASERAALGKPSVLGNFQLPSAFSPPKYIGISLDQNLFNGNDSFRTDSASPTCTSHESMEGSNDYDGEKGESPRSNASDPRDLRHNHRSDKPSTSCASSMAAVSAAAAAAVASIASSQVAASSNTVMSHLAHHPHPHAHHPAHHLSSLSAHHHHHHPNSSLLAAASMSHSLGLNGPPGLRPPPGHVPDMCPVCGIKLTPEEWNSHFLTELDRLYKLSSGMERTNLQATYMFAPPCPSQENAIRTSHNRWETFQRIRNNRQNRLRIKVRKRKYGDMYFMENMFCNSCPICKRKYALETGKIPPDDESKPQDEIETVDVESCNDDMPDSNSEMPQVHHAHMPALSGSSSHSSSHSSSNSANGAGNGATANLHNSNSQPGKLDGILYRTTACVINKDSGNSGHNTAGDEDVSTNVATTSSSTSSNSSSAGSTTNWTEAHTTPSSNNNHIGGSGAPQGHISVKNVSELSSTTHHYYNADSCNEERTAKDMSMDTCNNDSDEDVIVDDDDSVKMSQYSKKRKYEEAIVGSSRISDNPSPVDERPRSEPQVTSTESNGEHSHTNNNNNNNNNNNTKYTAFEDLRSKHQHHSQQPPPTHQHSMAHQTLERDSPTAVHPGHGGHGLMPGLSQLDTKVGNSSDIKPDEEDSKCFICKTGIKDFAADSFLRGRNFYFHQSCANVMSSYRLNKELQQQHQQQTEVGSSDKIPTQTSQHQPAQHQHVDNSNMAPAQNDS